MQHMGPAAPAGKGWWEGTNKLRWLIAQDRWQEAKEFFRVEGVVIEDHVSHDKVRGMLEQLPGEGDLTRERWQAVDRLLLGLRTTLLSYKAPGQQHVLCDTVCTMRNDVRPVAAILSLNVLYAT